MRLEELQRKARDYAFMRHCILAGGCNSRASQKAGPCIYREAAEGTNAWGLSGFQEWKLVLTNSWP